MEDDRDNDRIERLFAAVRKAHLYDAKLEYGFETRVMAKIMEQRNAQKPFFSWAWRLVPAFVSAVLILGMWTYMTEHKELLDLSSITGINSEETLLVASLTGE